MKKILLLLFIFSMFSGFLWSDNSITYLPTFSWYNPRIMAMGGDVTADPDGFTAFVSNPAGFVGYEKENKKTGEMVQKGEFTLLSINMALIANPFQAMDMANDIEEGADFMSAFLDYTIGQLEDNGMGADADLALASYVGRGWGIGFFTSAEAIFPQSDLALATEGSAMGDITVELGYAHKFEFDGFDWTIGGDVRPTYRILVPMTADSIINGVDDLTALTADSGYAFGLDMGTNLDWQSLTFALSLRDLFHTRYTMYEAPLNEQANFSFDTESDTEYITPMSMTFGVGWEPSVPAIDWLVQTSLVASYKTDLLIGIDPLDFHDYTQGTFYKSLHFGLETEWFKFLSLRAGLNGGYFTAGAGIDFFIGELNFAIFSEETGRTAGQTSQLGTALELAFRW